MKKGDYLLIIMLTICSLSLIFGDHIYALDDQGVVLINDRGDDRFADMDNEILVYLNDNLGSDNVWIFNFTSNTKEYITRDQTDQQFPRISDNIIVWSETVDQGDFVYTTDVYMYDLNTDEKTQLTQDVRVYSPDVSEGRIVWCEVSHENTTNIRMYDVETEQYTWLTSDKAQYMEKIQYWEPRIDGDRLVCSKTYSYYENIEYFWECDIILFDLESGQSTVLTPRDEKEHPKEYPVIHGDLVAWFDLREGRRSGGYNAKDVYVYDLSTFQETRITSDDSSLPFRLSVYGDVIVWEDSRDGDLDIYMYDVSEREEIQITNDDILQGGALVYEDLVFWSDRREGHFDIHVLDLMGDYSFIEAEEPIESVEPDTDNGEGFIPIPVSSILVGLVISTVSMLRRSQSEIPRFSNSLKTVNNPKQLFFLTNTCVHIFE